MSIIQPIALQKQVADPGKVLVNGDNFSKEVYLGDGAEPWQEMDAPADLWEEGVNYQLQNGVFTKVETPSFS
jgi:hypothetical protein